MLEVAAATGEVLDRFSLVLTVGPDRLLRRRGMHGTIECGALDPYLPRYQPESSHPTY